MTLTSKPTTLRPGCADSSPGPDLPGIDTSGLRRASALFEAGQIGPEAFTSMLKQELGLLESRSDALFVYAQRVSIELRQLRETREHAEVEQQDALRVIQDENDKFVEQLIAEHEAEIQTLRRERDAAIDRVRELSRGLSRVGSMSTPGMRRVSTHSLPALSATSADTSALRARVDELLFERERSLKLLRQLAEQRDLAEARLHTALSQSPQVSSTAPPPPPHEGLIVGRVPTLRVTNEGTNSGLVAQDVPREPPPSRSQPSHVVAPAMSAALPEVEVDPNPGGASNHAAPDAIGGRAYADSAVVRAAAQSLALQVESERSATEDWDLSPPTATTPSLTPALPAVGHTPVRPRQAGIQTLTTPENAQLNRPSAYSLASEDLPVEEVIRIRRPIKAQQDR